MPFTTRRRRFLIGFLELIDTDLPENPQERADELDDRIHEAKKLAWPDSPHGSTVTTTRTFAALFPHDFTTQRSPRRRPRSDNPSLYEVLGGADGTLREARVNRWILDRMEAAIGPVDRSDWNAVARRMMMPQMLYDISKEHLRPSDPKLSYRDSEGSGSNTVGRMAGPRPGH